MKFSELQAMKNTLKNRVKVQEELINDNWNSILGGNQPVVMALNILSSTFSKAKYNPYVSLFQAAIFVYQDFKEKKLPTSDNFMEYFISLADRLTQKSKKID